MKSPRSWLAFAWLALSLPALQGCFPVVATGAAVGALAVTDRRTVGAQTEDEAIEWKVLSRVSEKHKQGVHLNVTSYNRQVLLTGEIIDAAAREDVAAIAAQVENVKGVWNETTVGPESSLTGRSNDAFITSKVKARFVDASRFMPNHVKVVTEAGTVYLLGIVNEREAKAAIQIARTTDGVRKVINVLDVVPESETRRIDAAVQGHRP